MYFINMRNAHMKKLLVIHTGCTISMSQDELKQIIIKSEKENYYDGYVITHGTDTLEETAYLLDLTLNISKPIAITGAMRSSNEIGADGLYNFLSAIRVAISDEAMNMGV